MLKRRTILALLPLAFMTAGPALPSTGPAQAAAASPAENDAALIARIQAYLNSIRTLKARFMQVAPNGAITRGTAWLERPGRMRFQYDPPTPLLLVAGHGLVVFHDSKLNQTSNIPLGATPLGILLADHINLAGGGVTVTGIRRLPGQIQMTLVRTASRGDGSLTLDFADPPLALRQWTVTDAQGQRTTVQLYDIQMGGSFSPSLFEYTGPMASPGERGGGG